MSYMNNQRGKFSFLPINKDKYTGDINKIQCRSNWERLFCQFLDTNENVIRWSSEILSIEYFDPVKRKKRRYFPDFLAQMKNKEGKIITYLIEVKPYKETHEPKRTKNKKPKTLLKEELKWSTNQAKFDAAKRYCKQKGWIFKIITEKQLFKKK